MVASANKKQILNENSKQPLKENQQSQQKVSKKRKTQITKTEPSCNSSNNMKQPRIVSKVKTTSLSKNKQAETCEATNADTLPINQPSCSVDNTIAVETDKTIKKATKKRKPRKSTKKVCTEDCIPGKKSGCPIKSRRRKEGFVSCQEIHEMLKKMGIDDPASTSSCVKAAIMKGHIKITGDPKELDMVILKGNNWLCTHDFIATLGYVSYNYCLQYVHNIWTYLILWPN